LDRHGDVTWLADPVTGALSDSRVYDPFGEVAAVTGTSQITVGFQGDYTDPATADVRMGARWYDPTGAQFRTRDTVFGELATPVSLNRYTYGFANPLLYWDPDGRFSANSLLIDGERELPRVERTEDRRKANRAAALRRLRRIDGAGFDGPTHRPTTSSRAGGTVERESVLRGIRPARCFGSIFGGAFCPEDPDAFVDRGSTSRSAGGSTSGCSVMVKPQFCNPTRPFYGPTIGPRRPVESGPSPEQAGFPSDEQFGNILTGSLGAFGAAGNRLTETVRSDEASTSPFPYTQLWSTEFPGSG
jgi:RHS repeat-associated protein